MCWPSIKSAPLTLNPALNRVSSLASTYLMNSVLCRDDNVDPVDKTRSLIWCESICVAPWYCSSRLCLEPEDLLMVFHVFDGLSFRIVLVLSRKTELKSSICIFSLHTNSSENPEHSHPNHRTYTTPTPLVIQSVQTCPKVVQDVMNTTALNVVVVIADGWIIPSAIALHTLRCVYVRACLTRHISPVPYATVNKMLPIESWEDKRLVTTPLTMAKTKRIKARRRKSEQLPPRSLLVEYKLPSSCWSSPPLAQDEIAKNYTGNRGDVTPPQRLGRHGCHGSWPLLPLPRP